MGSLMCGVVQLKDKYPAISLLSLLSRMSSAVMTVDDLFSNRHEDARQLHLELMADLLKLDIICDYTTAMVLKNGKESVDAMKERIMDASDADKSLFWRMLPLIRDCTTVDEVAWRLKLQRKDLHATLKRLDSVLDIVSVRFY